MKRSFFISLALILSMGLSACNYVYPLPQAAPGAAEVTGDTKETEVPDAEPDNAGTEADGVRDKLSLGNEEGTGEESEEFTPTVEEDDIDAMAAKTEKEASNETVRGAQTSESTFTASDVAGYWKYDAYDNMYLALYDTGSYETYDLKTEDLLSAGTFEVTGSLIEMTEEGNDPETLEIISLLRLQDDEGDTLSPYRPVKPTSNDPSEVNRAGIHSDVVYEDMGDGNYKIRSQEKGVYIKYPSWFIADEYNDFLWASDGGTGYITGRNITDDYYSFSGSDEDYIRDVAAYYLGRDFEEIYGPSESSDNETFKWGENGYLGSFSVNFWNSGADIFAKSTVFFSPFDDGTYEVILINVFYGYGDRNAANNMAMPRVGGQR